MKTLLPLSALILASCGGNPPAIELTNATADKVEAALKQFNAITPPMTGGRWEVTRVPADAPSLEGLDQESAERIRALGKAMNTTTRCRPAGEPLDLRTRMMMQVAARPGCTVDRLTGDSGKLSYRNSCTIGDDTVRTDITHTFTPDRFETIETTEVDDSGDTRTRRFIGTHVGQCRGDENKRQPALSTDPA